MITLMEASEQYNVPHTTLKAAAIRYEKTKGKSGLRTKKIRGTNGRFVEHREMRRFMDKEYNPHMALRKENRPLKT